VRVSRRARRGSQALLARLGLAAVLLLLSAPALALVWRSAFGDELAARGVVSGVLLLAGLLLLGGAVLPLLPGTAPEPGERQPPPGVAALLRPPVLHLVLAVLVLAAAAVAVG